MSLLEFEKNFHGIHPSSNKNVDIQIVCFTHEL